MKIPSQWAGELELDVDEPFLGRGAFATILQTTNRSGQRFALKVMSRTNFAMRGIEKQLEAEISCMQRCGGDHVVRLFDVVEEDALVYLRMELCVGDLLQYTRSTFQCRLPETEASLWSRHLFLGLHQLHSSGVVHRDIKPENLLYTADRVLKIADFGWCAEVEQAPCTLAGTFQYMAPEILSGKAQTPAVDVWSGGLSMFQLMTAKQFLTTNIGPGTTKLSADHPHQATKLKTSWLAAEIFQRCPLTDEHRPSHMSLECWNFQKQVLVPEPQERILVADALAHRWLLLVQTDAADGNQHAQADVEMVESAGAKEEVTSGRFSFSPMRETEVASFSEKGGEETPYPPIVSPCRDIEVVRSFEKGTGVETPRPPVYSPCREMEAERSFDRGVEAVFTPQYPVFSPWREVKVTRSPDAAVASRHPLFSGERDGHIDRGSPNIPISKLPTPSRCKTPSKSRFSIVSRAPDSVKSPRAERVQGPEAPTWYRGGRSHEPVVHSGSPPKPATMRRPGWQSQGQSQGQSSTRTAARSVRRGDLQRRASPERPGASEALSRRSLSPLVTKPTQSHDGVKSSLRGARGGSMTVPTAPRDGLRRVPTDSMRDLLARSRSPSRENRAPRAPNMGSDIDLKDVLLPRQPDGQRQHASRPRATLRCPPLCRPQRTRTVAVESPCTQTSARHSPRTPVMQVRPQSATALDNRGVLQERRVSANIS